jgi:hypothetical protein
LKPIAVLGVGPAGLMAAHAVALAGRPVSLFSQPDKDGTVKRSRLGGAQFLHDPIPGVNDDEPDVVVTYRLEGEAEVYRRKIYGDKYVPSVSMEHVHDGQEQPAWNLQATYDKLWDLLSADEANAVVIDPAWIQMALEKEWFDFLISTIPATAICRAHLDFLLHVFESQQVRITTEPYYQVPDNTIVYNGTEDHSWFRASNLFGVESTEFPYYITPPAQTFVVAKPIRTNCACYPNIVRGGRYGTWTKGVLTHHAFIEAAKVVLG